MTIKMIIRTTMRMMIKMTIRTVTDLEMAAKDKLPMYLTTL